jgi:hypothetical protein
LYYYNILTFNRRDRAKKKEKRKKKSFDCELTAAMESYESKNSLAILPMTQYTWKALIMYFFFPFKKSHQAVLKKPDETSSLITGS